MNSMRMWRRLEIERRCGLNRTPSASRPNLNAVTCAGRVLAWMGRLLLMLVAVSLVTMPVTQGLWTWDHFLHGGQDFESSVLMILMIWCLALLLAQSCGRSFERLLARWPLLWSLCRGYFPAAVSRGEAVAAFRNEPEPVLMPGIYNLPLRI